MNGRDKRAKVNKDGMDGKEIRMSIRTKLKVQRRTIFPFFHQRKNISIGFKNDKKGLGKRKNFCYKKIYFINFYKNCGKTKA